MIRVFFAGVLALLVFSIAGCATLPVGKRISPEDPRVVHSLEKLREASQQRKSLMGMLKLSVDHAEDSFRSKQRVFIESPLRLRVEVIGLLNQPVAALVVDGDFYSQLRVQDRFFESGVVYPALLRDVSGIDLEPLEAMPILLAAPEIPGNDAIREVRLLEEGLSIEFDGDPARILELDAKGQLRRETVLNSGREVRWVAEYQAYEEKDGFPRQIEMELGETGSRLKLQYSRIELNAHFEENLFQLSNPWGEAGSKE